VTSTLRVALVEPYLGGSHRAWALGLARHSRHDVTIAAHDARFWKWRMQGGYLTLADHLRELAASGPFDVVLGSSMLHLSAFLGAARDLVGDAAVIAYFHESQLTYPLSPQDRPDDAYAMINWGSAAVADVVLFNSAYHLETFFAAVERFLRRFPDHDHAPLVDGVRERASVLEPGVDLRRFDAAAPVEADPPVLLWNQRWEFDKGPGEFAAAVTALAAAGRDFRVVMTGERFVGQPEEFEALPGVLGERLVHFGFAADEAYPSLVATADVVVSTALQEFFGIALTEAAYCGAFPVVPARLVYPERIPLQFHDRCLYPEGGLVPALEWALDHPDERRRIAAAVRGEMARFDWATMAPRYDAVFERAAASRAQ
jgi:glycosyltransferase involved in cell wall biosynthesis